MRQYHAAYHEIEDGWYFAEVLDFPGVISQGRTLRSARRMIRDALRLMVELYVEECKNLPEPNPKAKSREGKPVFREKIPVSVHAVVGAFT